MSANAVGFLEIFPDCAGLSGLCGGLDKAEVTSVVVNSAELTMEVEALFTRAPAPAELSSLENELREEYGLASVRIEADYPRAAQEKQPGGASRVLYGKAIKEPKLVEMSALNLESGTVAVKGEVFAVNNREIQKRGAYVLSFDMTDYIGSVRVNKFFDKSEDAAVLSKIKPGQTLIVRGRVTYNKFDNDMVLEPYTIMASKPELRPDGAKEKRVELHFHTRYSTLDALTDPAKAVERAAAWGHPAIAVTDHGTAQAFPEMSKAGKKYGVKILYGIEGYYVNDLEERPAVRGCCNNLLDCEFVAFDVETTGLSAVTDRLTEIGAVLFKGGEVRDKFSTFVDPKMPIPANITELTGIRDSDVAGAPSEAEAMRAFLDFAGDRPIIAHNASFDTGFMAAACERSGIRFEPVVLDTLVLSQRLLPELKRHKLDIVSKHLGLPEFNHHRAFDDAEVVARMMERFIPMLQSHGAERVADIDGVLRKLSGAGTRKVRHISLLVRNKVGLKNLYKLISASYLKHYSRNPIIPRSLLERHREGLLIGSACEAGEVFDAVLRGAPGAELKRIASFYDYIEVMPIANNRFLVENGTVRDDEGLRDLNRRVARLAAELEKPLVATGDVHFLDPKDEIYRRILQAAKKFSDADRENPLYYRTTEEMLEEFAYLGQRTCYEAVITNPNRIADMCEEIQLLPDGLFPPKIENSAEILKDLVYGRMHEIYGENPPEIVTKRVETELGDILSRHYDVIYMSAQKLVADSNAHGYLVGSRGSVGSSIVAYMSGITEVNSLPPHYVCPKCHHTDFESGAGYGCGADMPDKTCPECGGTGQVKVQQRTPIGVIQTTRTCTKCSGKGKIVKEPCGDCRGMGRVRHTRTLEVSVPAGIDDGQTFVLRGQGDEGLNGGPSGDVNIMVTLRPDTLFERDGFDVWCDIPITFTQAVLGDEIVVPTIDGKVKWSLPAGTQPGATFRLRGKGIPSVNGRGRGDQFVQVTIEVPKNLSQKQKDILKEFDSSATDRNYQKRKGFRDKLKDMFQ